MRNFLIIALFATMAVSVLFAQATDDFTITVTVNYIEFELRTADDSGDYSLWAIGNVNAGETAEMTTGAGGDHVYVSNSSNVPLDFSAYSTSPAPASCGFGTATAWTPAVAAGVDMYLLEIDKGEVGTVPPTYTTIDGNSIGTSDLFYSASAGESYHLYTKFTAPTSASDGCEHSITVNIVATTP